MLMGYFLGFWIFKDIILTLFSPNMNINSPPVLEILEMLCLASMEKHQASKTL